MKRHGVISKTKRPQPGEKADERPKIGSFLAAGNLFFGRKAHPPLFSKNPNYVGERVAHFAPEPKEIDHLNQSAPRRVSYALPEILLQPTPNSCGDACAMMILQFHRDNLQRLATQGNLDAKIIKQIEATLNYLNTKTSEVQWPKRYTRLSSELEDIYGVKFIKIKAKKSNVDEFSNELAFHLYTRGPLQIRIKTRDYHVTSHEILLLGVIGNQVIYADPWDGKQRHMSIEKLAKQFNDKDNEVFRISVEGYSYAFLESIKKDLQEEKVASDASIPGKAM